MEACLRTHTDYIDTANYEPENTDDPAWRKVYEKRCREKGFTAYFDYSWQWAYREKYEKAGGKQYVATAYYDQILKNKDALSDTSKDVDILDLIFENVVYDVGVIYGFEGLSTLHTNLMENNAADIASALESVRGQVTEKISQIVEQYAK